MDNPAIRQNMVNYELRNWPPRGEVKLDLPKTAGKQTLAMRHKISNDGGGFISPIAAEPPPPPQAPLRPPKVIQSEHATRYENPRN